VQLILPWLGSCKGPQSRNTYLFRRFLAMSSPFHPCAADCDGQENGQNTHPVFGFWKGTNSLRGPDFRRCARSSDRTMRRRWGALGRKGSCVTLVISIHRLSAQKPHSRGFYQGFLGLRNLTSASKTKMRNLVSRSRSSPHISNEYTTPHISNEYKSMQGASPDAASLRMSHIRSSLIFSPFSALSTVTILPAPLPPTSSIPLSSQNPTTYPHPTILLQAPPPSPPTPPTTLPNGLPRPRNLRPPRLHPPPPQPPPQPQPQPHLLNNHRQRTNSALPLRRMRSRDPSEAGRSDPMPRLWVSDIDEGEGVEVSAFRGLCRGWGEGERKKGGKRGGKGRKEEWRNGGRGEGKEGKRE